jgi:Flp pilus assembly protein CpaB
MKKNLVPLLGIAFVVAILSTAVFYALIASKLTGSAQANSIPAGASIADRRNGSPPGVRPGLRAVSVQVADSSGILEMLEAGSRVDIQAVYSKSGSPHEVEMRTVLQNIEVLKVRAEPVASPGRPALPVVTFLTSPVDADILALADSGARVRVALRHPDDQSYTERRAIEIGALIRSRSNQPRLSRNAPAVVSPLNTASTAACAPASSLGANR